MTDERDKQDLAAEGGVAPVPETPPVDPWAEAFEKVAGTPAAPGEGDQAGEGGADGAGAGAGGEDAAAAAGVPADDAGMGEGTDGGSALPAGGGGDADDDGTVGDVDAAVEQISEELEQRAINETAALFRDRVDPQGNKAIRQQPDGVLGASINDPDICRTDPNTGLPVFYNPDTGLPFTGDNPRAQAKAWVEAYNDELRAVFNRMAETRQAELAKEAEPVIQLLKFTPVYEKLDATRQRMFDALIEGYEVHDAQGNHVGYSVDLEATLERVNRQVAALQAGRQVTDPAAPVAPAAPADTTPTGPALDMPTTGGAAPAGGAPKSLEEAIEAVQDAEAAKLKPRR